MTSINLIKSLKTKVITKFCEHKGYLKKLAEASYTNKIFMQ